MTLCIIDMQNKFEAARAIISDVLDLIEQAVKRREGIILVEFHTGSTHRKIYTAIKEYDRQTTVIKYDNGGGQQVVNAISALRFNPNRIRFCGVNGCACILATVRETAEHLPKSTIEVISRAIACTCSGKYKNISKCLEQLRSIYGVIIV